MTNTRFFISYFTGSMNRFFLVLAIVLSPYANAEIAKVFAGGVSGIEALAVAPNSDTFRSLGGGIYLHNSGWNSSRLTNTQRQSIINSIWNNSQFGIELGYKDNDVTAWQTVYQNTYHNLGIRPSFITCNAFSSDRVPVVSQWLKTIDAYRAKGVTGSIFATFEYQNFPTKMNGLDKNKVSQRADFQNIIRASKGLTIDVPPAVYFRRINSTNLQTRFYKDWVVDAVKWAKNQGYDVGIIVSSNSSGTRYDEDTAAFVNELRNAQALPTFFIVENYSTASPSTYPNPVGSEDNRDHQLGNALSLLKSNASSSQPASSKPASSVSVSSIAVSSMEAASSMEASSVDESSVATSSTPTSSASASSAPASSKPASSIPASSKPASSKANSSLAISSVPSVASCERFIDIAFDARVEVTLTAGTCLRFGSSLADKDLQIWDSDISGACDYRGVLRSVNGTGSLTVNSNYVTTALLTGTQFSLTNAAGNSCNRLKVRAY